MKFGLCMGGNEALFEILLRARAQAVLADNAANSSMNPHAPFLYVEVGVGGGETFVPVMDLLDTIQGIRAYGIGLDIKNGWSYDTTLPERLQTLPHKQRTAILIREDVNLFEMQNALPDKKFDIKDSFDNDSDFNWHADFVFIDGCHGAACAKKDLLSVIPFLNDGAVVVFHDASPKCQGHHMQPHCGTGIDVRRALNDLGLFKSNYPFRFLEETDADHGIAAFQFIIDSKKTKPLF